VEGVTECIIVVVVYNAIKVGQHGNDLPISSFSSDFVTAEFNILLSGP
jgi:hypothetical protein